MVTDTCSPEGGEWEQFLESGGGAVWREPWGEGHLMEKLWPLVQWYDLSAVGLQGGKPRLGPVVFYKPLLSVGQTQLEARGLGSPLMCSKQACPPPDSKQRRAGHWSWGENGGWRDSQILKAKETLRTASPSSLIKNRATERLNDSRPHGLLVAELFVRPEISRSSVPRPFYDTILAQEFGRKGERGGRASEIRVMFHLTINSLNRCSVPHVTLEGFKWVQNSVMIGCVLNKCVYWWQ